MNNNFSIPPGVSKPLGEAPSPQNLDVDADADKSKVHEENTAFETALDNKKATEDQAREALLDYVGTTCCWGSGPAQECEIIRDGKISFVINFDTFVEYRTQAEASCAYHLGTPVTLQGAGQVPELWQIFCPPHTNFLSKETKHEIDFTSKVRNCNRCGGNGKVRCHVCGGDGRCRCNRCGGDGKIEVKSVGSEDQVTRSACNECGGDGQKRCDHSDCNGTGQIACHTCDGTGKLRFFQEMTRHLQTIKISKVINSIPESEIPNYLLIEASSQQHNTILEQSAWNVELVKGGFNNEIDSALVSTNQEALNAVLGLRNNKDPLVQQHQQRLTMKGVAATRCTCKAGENEFHFWVYGPNHSICIHEEWGYPAQQCCGYCIIM